MQIDRKVFFDHIREGVFGGVMTKPQVNGIVFKLDAWEDFPKNSDIRHLAYALATSYHETAFTMQPIREKGGIEYFFTMYDKAGDRPKVAKALGNTRPGDGIRFSGRGDVQLTGRTNYERASSKLNIDFTQSPELAMSPTTSAYIMYYGMSEGWFTGKKLRDYFHGAKADWTGARKIINGTDKAEAISKYAKKFYAALLEAQLDDAATPEGKPVYASTTNFAALGLTVSGAATTFSGVREGVQQATALTADAQQIAPWLGFNQATLVAGLGIVIVCLAVYVIRERMAKRELGV